MANEKRNKMQHENMNSDYKKGSITLGGAVAMGTGVMIGAGIFGAIGTAAAAVFLFHEPVNVMRVTGVLLILAGIVALKFA